MRRFLFIFLAVFSPCSHAEPDNTCWGDPVNIAVVTISSASFSSNKKGASARMRYSTVPDRFPAVCNRNMEGSGLMMSHYVDMGSGLAPSDLNPGYFKLNEDVDIRISSAATGSAAYEYFPLAPPGLKAFTVPPVGQGTRGMMFSTTSQGYIYLMLRRNIIGGAVVVPSNTELFSVYRVMYTNDISVPRPSRPSKPLVQARTRPGGQVIPVPSECSINQGNVINVNFGMLQTALIPASSSGKKGEGYSKDITLSFNCNSSLTQNVKVKLVADTSMFSSDLIRSDNADLGFALKNNERLVKPMGAFPIRLEDGLGRASITLMPVRNPQAELKGGVFNASATLVIQSL
ncbi:fimbrial protein [Serratia rubidaea]|nr:fimbrial protein [Serratia rubidaea]